MKIWCWGREASRTRIREAGYVMPNTRDQFFGGADVLSLHMPLNAETRGIVTRSDLSQMKSTALIVNTSRAGLIVEGALFDALRCGCPGFAAVDVYEEEPVTGG